MVWECYDLFYKFIVYKDLMFITLWLIDWLLIDSLIDWLLCILDQCDFLLQELFNLH